MARDEIHLVDAKTCRRQQGLAPATSLAQLRYLGNRYQNPSTAVDVVLRMLTAVDFSITVPVLIDRFPLNKSRPCKILIRGKPLDPEVNSET